MKQEPPPPPLYNSVHASTSPSPKCHHLPGSGSGPPGCPCSHPHHPSVLTAFKGTWVRSQPYTPRLSPYLPGRKNSTHLFPQCPEGAALPTTPLICGSHQPWCPWLFFKAKETLPLRAFALADAPGFPGGSPSPPGPGVLRGPNLATAPRGPLPCLLFLHSSIPIHVTTVKKIPRTFPPEGRSALLLASACSTWDTAV